MSAFVDAGLRFDVRVDFDPGQFARESVAEALAGAGMELEPVVSERPGSGHVFAPAIVDVGMSGEVHADAVADVVARLLVLSRCDGGDGEVRVDLHWECAVGMGRAELVLQIPPEGGISNLGEALGIVEGVARDRGSTTGRTVGRLTHWGSVRLYP